MSVIGSQPTQFRGTTIQWSSIFYDFSRAVTQPSAATVEITYIDPTETEEISVSIPMTPPQLGQVAWTAMWDSSLAAPGPVTWSIRSDPAPRSTQDGRFMLVANTANLAAQS
jgi:hypothetical protein